jgi:hypothetical protein
MPEGFPVLFSFLSFFTTAKFARDDLFQLRHLQVSGGAQHCATVQRDVFFAVSQL